MDFMRASPDGADLASASSWGIRSVDLCCVVVIEIILAWGSGLAQKMKGGLPGEPFGTDKKAPASEGGRYKGKKAA